MVLETLGEGEGVLGVADDEGDDGRGGVGCELREGPAEVCEFSAESCGDCGEALLVLGFVAEDGEGFGDDGGVCGWLGGGVDEGSCGVDEGVDEGCGSGDETAYAAEGLAGGGDDGEASVGDVLEFAESGGGGSEDACAVGLIDDELGLVLFGEVGECGEVGCVAVHGEDGIGDDEAVAG